jgi:heme/copper-type cytochrome/quinol oxidase subunit 1
VLVEMTPRVLGTFASERLGILYILSALLFLSVGGVEALIIRIQLIHAHNNFVSPQVFNRMFTMHGTTMIFFVVMPVLFGFANYLVPLMIGARYGVPPPECFQFLVVISGRTSSLFQFSRRKRPVRRRKRTGRRLVGLCATGCASVLPRP